MNFKIDKFTVNTIKGNVLSFEGLSIEDAPENFLEQFARLMEADKAPSERNTVEALDKVMRNFQRSNMEAKERIAQQKTIAEQLVKSIGHMFPKEAESADDAHDALAAVMEALEKNGATMETAKPFKKRP